MTELGTAVCVRSLGPQDLGILLELLDQDRLANLFVRYRLDATRLDARWLGAQIWGYFEDDRLISACHVGANIVPIQSTEAATAVFADRLMRRRIRPGSIVGTATTVLDLWDALSQRWAPARSLRANQPFLVLDRDSSIPPNTAVRRVRIDEVDKLYPACVAMFTEEVGISPEIDSHGGYRARVAQLITQGWSFALIEDGEVIFKAEVGAATAYACQLQGVWVAPSHRGTGLAAPALSAVVHEARRTIAPVVTLYVNDFNHPARALYSRVGFEHRETFATVLL